MARPSSSTRAGNWNILYVCRTCPRYEPLPPANERTRGASLAERVKELVLDGRGGDTLKVLVVNCLNGCPSPCNASLGGPGKTRIRFSHLEADDAADLLAAAEDYANTEAGGLAADQLPTGLQAKLTARSPGAIKPRAQFSGRHV